MTDEHGDIICSCALQLLRSRFFSILTALLVFAGNSALTCDACEHEHAAIAGETGEPAHADSDGQGCDCVCHQTFVNDLSGHPAVVGRSFGSEVTFVVRADIPPDDLAFGIDHPPQLA